MLRYTSSRSTTMAILLLMLLGAVVVALPRGASAVILKGQKYAYSIPDKYEQSARSIFYFLFKDVKGLDDAPSTHMLVPGIDFGLGSNVSFQLHLFHDRVYSQRALLRMAEHISTSADEVGQRMGLYLYTEELAGRVSDYYFSFDAAVADLNDISERDFYARVRRSVGLQIGDLRAKPENTCMLSSVHDGILIDSYTSGEFCVPSNLVKFKSLQDRLMKTWRVE